MTQIALPLANGGDRGASRIVVGAANAHVIEALGRASEWPFRTAVLFGPPRSGKSLIARWFAASGGGEAIDDAERLDETDLFHRWNRAQESGTPLLLVCNAEEDGGGQGWKIALPDLASRMGAALHLSIGESDDAMLAELIALHAELRGFALGPDAAAYLVPRMQRSHMAAQALVAAIDRISMERKAPPTLSIWRDALEDLTGESQPRLL
jgi:hypothetical protein